MRRLVAQQSKSGGMAALVRDFDWAATPLGPPEAWPAELRSAVAQVLDSRFPSAVVWGEGLTTIYNDAFRPILGQKPEALGRSFADVWAEAWPEIGPIADKAFAGESTYIEDFPLVVDRNGGPEQAWFTFCYSPLRLSDGTVAGMLDTVIETTGTVMARANLDLINQELSHRLKNTLALVQAIATQTLRGSADPETLDRFRDRMVALGRAHDVLISEHWRTAALDEVTAGILKPLDIHRQIAVSGPAIRIGSRATVSLAMILHELATNAAKYGALSVPSGRVDLSWSVDDALFRLTWHESGGPTVTEPTRQGFGSRLIDRALGGRCKVTRELAPSGLRLELDCPLVELTEA